MMPEIYCLYSPRDGTPRYIGQTDVSARKRWQQHIACALRKEPGPLYDWIRELFAEGLDPGYHVLQENVIPADLTMFEAYWIEQFAGLLNQRGNGSPAAHSKIGASVIAVINGRTATGTAWEQGETGDEPFND